MDSALAGRCDVAADRPPTGINQPITTTADSELLRRISAGDLGLFDHFVDRYKHRLVRYITLHVRGSGGVHLAEDLAQETFLRVVRAARRGGYTGEASAATWLFTIARNCIIDHLRLSGRRPLVLRGDLAESDRPPDPRAGPDSDPLERAALSESHDRVSAILARLPVPQRDVAALKVLGGLSSGEIAELTGSSVATVKSRLIYGLKKIRQAILDRGRI